jgi:hypothetical protein
MIVVEFVEDSVFAAATLKGIATWWADRDVFPRSIIVALGWRTEGRGDVDSDRVAEWREAGRTVFAGEVVRVPFTFEIPGDGPVSYDGKLIRVIWEVRVRVDLPWAVDEKAEFPFRVRPRQIRR